MDLYLNIILMFSPYIIEATNCPIRTEDDDCHCTKTSSDESSVKCVNTTMDKIRTSLSAFSTPIELLDIENLDMNVKKINNGMFSHKYGIRRISITGSGVHELQEQAFVGLEKSLERLAIRQSRIRKFPENAIGRLKALKRLDLSSNQLILKTNSFSRLGLRELDLDDNYLAKVDEDSFIGLETTLHTLSLKRNRLRDVNLNVLLGLKALRNVNLSANRIRTISSAKTTEEPTIENLDLSRNRIGAITRNSLSEVTSLRYLNVSYNMIDSVEDGALDELRHLLVLDLSFNGIHRVASRLLHSNRKLQYLSFSGNGLTQIPDRLLDDLKDLQVLRLSENALRNIEIDVTGTSLTALFLDHNSISVLREGTFGSIRNLTLLDLSYNSIRFVQDKLLEELKAVRTLNLNENLLNEWNDRNFDTPLAAKKLTIGRNRIGAIKMQSFAKMRMVEHLDANRNGIGHIEEAAFHNCARMTHLDLGSNRLSNIGNIFSLFPSRLRFLNFENNAMKVIGSNELKGLAMLEELKLGWNTIDEIPGDVFRDTKSLRRLHLEGNNISRIAPEAFARLEMLTFLNLEENLLKEITIEAFKGLASLQELLLKDNRIMDVEPQAMQRLPKLTHLDLSRNEIFVLRKYMFEGFVPIRRLLLNDMSIQEVEVGAFQDLLSLEELRLGSNAITKLNFDFMALPRLWAFSADGNNISSEIIVTEDLRYVTSQITELDFENCGLEELDRKLIRLTSKVRMLNLRRNRLRKISSRPINLATDVRVLLLDENVIDEFVWIDDRTLKTLRHLSLAGNKLSKIDHISTTFDNDLRKLNLSANSIRSIRGSVFKQLVHLRSIDLSNNLISYLSPLTFMGLDNLKSVHLDRNNFATIPFAIRGLKDIRLALVTLGGNPFEMISTRFSKFAESSEIDEIELGGGGGDSKIENFSSSVFVGIGKISRLSLNNVGLINLDPKTFRSIPDLVELDIGRNPLPRLENRAAIWRQFTELKVLNLTWTNLTSVPKFASSMERLLDLDLSNNEMTRIYQGSFQHLRALERLYMRDNRIQELSANAFISNLRLQTLDLSDNNLKIVDVAVFRPVLHSLKSLLLTGNRLLCHCKVSFFWRWMESNKRLFDRQHPRMWKKCLHAIVSANGCPGVTYSEFVVDIVSATKLMAYWRHQIYPVKETKLTIRTGDQMMLNLSVSESEYLFENLAPGTWYQICIQVFGIEERQMANTGATDLQCKEVKTEDIEVGEVNLINIIAASAIISLIIFIIGILIRLIIIKFR